jgi:hypothetical protein
MKFLRNYYKLILFISFTLLIFSYLREVILFFSSEQACCEIFEQDNVANNNWVYRYRFNYKDSLYVNYESMVHIKKIDLDSLIKIECIKVEYSTYFPSISKIVDERVLR